MLCIRLPGRSVVRPRRQPNNPHSFVSKKTDHPLVHIHLFVFLSLLSARLPPLRCTAWPQALPGTARDHLRVAALGCRPCQVWHAAALSKSRGRSLPVAHAANATLPRRVATAVAHRLQAPPLTASGEHQTPMSLHSAK
jgi:hypothetical protein